MTFSLFDIRCPSCAGLLDLSADGRTHCATCASDYLVRMGHLVPVKPPAMASASRPIGSLS